VTTFHQSQKKAAASTRRSVCVASVLYALLAATCLQAQEYRVDFLISTDSYVLAEWIDFGFPSISNGDSDALYGFKVCPAGTPYICLISNSPDYNFAFPRDMKDGSNWIFAGYKYEVIEAVTVENEIVYSISSANVEPHHYYADSDTTRMVPYEYKSVMLYSPVRGLLSIKRMLEFDGVSREPQLITFVDGRLDLDAKTRLTEEPWLFDDDQVSRLTDPNFRRDPELIPMLSWRK
jgi:hypothetical protein